VVVDSNRTWIPPAGEETHKFPCNTPPSYGNAARVSTENKTGRWILVAGYWSLDTGFSILDTGSGSLVTGCWLLDTGFSILVTGNWFLENKWIRFRPSVKALV